jgi:cobalt/nickel transport system permease protein
LTLSRLDPYVEGASPLHRADPRVKLLLTLGFVLASALLPDGAWAAFIMLLSLVTSAALLSQIKLASLLRRSLLALPFLLAAFPLLFNIPGDILAQFTVFGRVVSISLPGLEKFLTIALKSWISILAAILFTAVTTFPQVLTALRALKVPRLLVALIGLMWRYLFVMVATAARLLRARESRSGGCQQPGVRSGGSLAWRAKVTGGMAGSLLLRSIERSERVYAAMLSRGYDGEIRCLPHPPLQPGAWAVLVGGLVTYGLIFLVGWWITG